MSISSPTQGILTISLITRALTMLHTTTSCARTLRRHR